MMCRLRNLLFAVCLGVVASGCGGTSSGYIPASSPLVKFQAPETEELLPDTASEGDDVDDMDEDLFGEEAEEGAAAAPAPTTMARPAPQ